MAGRLYTSATLNANWFEERAPPLKGVVADYGFRELATTAKDTIKNPAKHREFSKPAGSSRYGMVCRDTLSEATESWAGGAPTGPSFGAVIPTHPKDYMAREMSTTQGAAFGVAPKKTRFEKLAEKSARREAPTAKPKKEAGMKASGATGEVYKEEEDPQNNTAAQRSWLYSEDPMLKTRKAPPAEPAPREYMSLDIVEGPGVPEGPKGRRANMTLNDAETSRRPGKNVWADEIRHPGF
mmetsp:Transcript_13046/g.45599  ORF Transcript_13046/g.45599 Transcript_13046/m.45599 type:complete len:239 (-) Transcript_13046:217-933(-)